ncbi:hypothetical protein JL100_013075 [Skermanella mucosa]|uniref:hypothetical protein n=1 Tax=Skermanella mucosa TaxID=1789672 RepID=UPI00192C3C88|nr:hypothetical protein [Skermanella mucosa]UEM23622.1 hypothetical protein JL100_013075 [Skermanella mucosa]
MSAEAGNEPEAPKRRGRIPQSAWPHILERHRAGATLSAIAREFDCTPSAISYIVRKAEASGMEPAPPRASETASPAEEEQATPAREPDTAAQPQQQPAPDEAEEPASAPTPSVAEKQPVAEPPAEPRPAPRRSATPEGRTQLRASDIGRNAAQSAGRTAESAPAAAPVEARPAPVAAIPQPQPVTGGETARVASPSGRPEPAPPVDAVEGRLRDTARSCLVAYRGWKQAPSEGSIQTLHDAVHELRKALARIEIDMSASRRDEQVNRPIPIPAHRAARRPR